MATRPDWDANFSFRDPVPSGPVFEPTSLNLKSEPSAATSDSVNVHSSATGGFSLPTSSRHGQSLPGNGVARVRA